MRISAHVTMTRKMLADGTDAALAQTLHECGGKLRYGLRVAMEGTIPDDAAVAVIDVEHRCEAQVHAMRPELRRQDESDILSQMSRLLRITVPRIAQRAHGRKDGEA